MKRLIIISFILISTNAFAFGKCEDRLQEIEEDLSRVRHHLGLYKTTQYLGLYKTTQLFETDRLKILEDKVVYLEKYLNIYIPDPNYAFSYYSKVPKGKIEQISEKIGYEWKEETKEKGFYKIEGKK